MLGGLGLGEHHAGEAGQPVRRSTSSDQKEVERSLIRTHAVFDPSHQSTTSSRASALFAGSTASSMSRTIWSARDSVRAVERVGAGAVHQQPRAGVLGSHVLAIRHGLIFHVGSAAAAGGSPVRGAGGPGIPDSSGHNLASRSIRQRGHGVRWRPCRSDQVIVGVGPVSPEDVVRVARGGWGVRLADDALAEIARSRAVVDALAEDDRPHYGISTGFGALATAAHPARAARRSCSAA